MLPPQIVIDTNVLVAGLRSRNPVAFLLLSLVGTGRLGINLSVPLDLEYEDVLLRWESGIPLSAADLTPAAFSKKVGELKRPH